MVRTGTTQSLTDAEARSELYALLHSNASRKEAIERVLEIGTEYLEIKHGHITDIDPEENRWEVIGSTDPPDGAYPEGLTAKLSHSYCRRTFQQPTPLALHDAGNQGWADDPAYQHHQLDTYLGIRIEVFGEPYGTICFVESEPRNTQFTESELIFVELAAQVLRKLLEESQHQKNVANRDRLISVLNRVLRHNLRNDMNVVRGNAQILKERVTGDAARLAATIDSTATKLLSLAEKSRELDQLTRSVPVERPMNIVPVVEGTVAEIRDRYPAVDISLNAPEEAVAFAAPQLSDALSELLTNAVEHTGTEPSIEVSVAPEGEKMAITITDTGQGLPPDELGILTGVNESALEHGSGLGLALVYWIITNLDGQIDVHTSQSGTTIEIHLQTAPSTAPGK